MEFSDLIESGTYILIRIDMLLGKMFKKLSTSLIRDKKNNIIYLKVIITYNNKLHTCVLKINKKINKDLAELYVNNLIDKIEKKLELNYE
jgi:hypothetical protein